MFSLIFWHANSIFLAPYPVKACPTLPHFSTKIMLQTVRFSEMYISYKIRSVCLICLHLISETLLNPRRIHRDIINYLRIRVECLPVIYAIVTKNCTRICSRDYSKTRLHRMPAQLFHVDRLSYARNRTFFATLRTRLKMRFADM